MQTNGPGRIYVEGLMERGKGHRDCTGLPLLTNYIM